MKLIMGTFHSWVGCPQELQNRKPSQDHTTRIWLGQGVAEIAFGAEVSMTIFYQRREDDIDTHHVRQCEPVSVGRRERQFFTIMSLNSFLTDRMPIL
jgi:hypothetical protein